MSKIKTAVIGFPVKHSKSPLIHQYWMQKLCIDGSYDAIDIAPENLEKEIKTLITQGYRGFNITVPHKVAMMDLCDEVDAQARTIGAINTVSIKNGKLCGTNTDAFGFIENLYKNAPNFDFAAGPALVLGAGGAARAILYGLIEAGTPEIHLINRTRSKAESLKIAAPSKIKIIDWNERDTPKTLNDINILVNTTSLGMAGNLPLEMDIEDLPKSALVTDIVYAPLITRLLQQARMRENPYVTGIGMLLHQARPAFKLWHGVMPDVTPELEELVLK